MWIVTQEIGQTKQPALGLININSIVHSVHLIGIAGSHLVPYEVDHTNALEAFKTFYINKYIDYHTYEVVF